MTETDAKVIQASPDQLQKQLNAIYTNLLFDSIPDDAPRKKLKLETSAEWTAQYLKAKNEAKR